MVAGYYTMHLSVQAKLFIVYFFSTQLTKVRDHQPVLPQVRFILNIFRARRRSHDALDSKSLADVNDFGLFGGMHCWQLCCFFLLLDVGFRKCPVITPPQQKPLFLYVEFCIGDCQVKVPNSEALYT